MDLWNNQIGREIAVEVKKELDARVLIGDLIYVKDYVRSDGKKVSGYYRRRPVH